LESTVHPSPAASCAYSNTNDKAPAIYCRGGNRAKKEGESGQERLVAGKPQARHLYQSAKESSNSRKAGTIVAQTLEHSGCASHLSGLLS
jgi:hypothetical protein